jgi:hypothetical protein
MNKQTEVERIAAAFVAVCEAAFTSAEMAEIRHRNREYQSAYDGLVCATHDFADANDFMLEAFQSVMGREAFLNGDGGDEDNADMDLMGAAWELATPSLTLQDGAPSPYDATVAEYDAWRTAEGLPADTEGMELLFCHDLTEDQRAWLEDFSARSDAMSDAMYKGRA